MVRGAIAGRHGRKTWLLVLATSLAFAVLAWAATEQLNVQVRTAKVRSKPSFLGAPVGDLAYGATVTVQGRQGPWVQVTGPGKVTGWLHESALTQKKVAMQAGGGAVGTGASGSEVALAGKGFNAQVEKEYRLENKDLDYTWVDRMEKTVVTAAEAERFLGEGQIRQPEGGR